MNIYKQRLKPNYLHLILKLLKQKKKKVKTTIENLLKCKKKQHSNSRVFIFLW